MKKLIALALSAVILAVSLCISVPAAGTIVFSDNFDNGFLPRNWITDREECGFEWDRTYGCINGYDSAVYLQSNYTPNFSRMWDKFYASMDVQIRGFDDLPEVEGRLHYVKMVYIDLFESEKKPLDQNLWYTYTIEIETGKAVLEKEFSYTDGSGATQSFSKAIAEGQIPAHIIVGKNADWFNIGMRVTDGKIGCYYNDQLVLSSSAEDAGEEYLGGISTNAVDPTVGSQKSALLFGNIGNWIAFDNFEVWTSDYDFGDPVLTSELYLERVPSEEGEIIFDLYLNDAASIGVSGIAADISYPGSLTLKSSEYLYPDGLCFFSESIDANPYTFSAVIGTSTYPVNEKTPVARFVFEANESLASAEKATLDLVITEMIDVKGTEYTKDAVAKDYVFIPSEEVKSVEMNTLPDKTVYVKGDRALDLANGTITVNHWDGSAKEVELAFCSVSDYRLDIVGEQTVSVLYKGYTTSFTVTVEPIPGDVNGDDKVGLADVASVLKHIAKWEIALDLVAADVNDDSLVNMTDASLMLKYIAKWDVVLK